MLITRITWNKGALIILFIQSFICHVGLLTLRPQEWSLHNCLDWITLLMRGKVCSPLRPTHACTPMQGVFFFSFYFFCNPPLTDIWYPWSKIQKKPFFFFFLLQLETVSLRLTARLPRQNSVFISKKSLPQSLQTRFPACKWHLIETWSRARLSSSPALPFIPNTTPLSLQLLDILCKL